MCHGAKNEPEVPPQEEQLTLWEDEGGLVVEEVVAGEESQK